MLETPNTAPKKPEYLPRSLGGTTSPIAAWALTISPPPPRPWIARKAINSVIPWARPHSADPIRKRTSAACSTTLRPSRSPSFPYSGVTIVTASRYAVTTHDRCARPPRSPTIVGSAVETIVWSSDASSITSSSAPKIRRTRWAGRRSWTAAIRTGLPAYVHERHHRLAVQQLVGLDLGAGALHARAEGLEERVGRLEEVHRGRAEVHRHHEPRPDSPHELGGGPAADR